LGWFRDAHCNPPDWPMKELSDQQVTVNVPASSWQVEFFDTVTGKSISKGRIMAAKQRLRVTLPAFEGSVAVKMERE